MEARIQDVVDLLGEQSEAELLAILYTKHPDKAPGFEGLSPEQEDAVYAPLSDPKNHRSTFFECVIRLRGAAFCKGGQVQIGVVRREGEMVLVQATRSGQTVTFVFDGTHSTIENILLPDGTAVFELIRSCGVSAER
jgi:hypothetical protein